MHIANSPSTSCLVVIVLSGNVAWKYSQLRAYRVPLFLWLDALRRMEQMTSFASYEACVKAPRRENGDGTQKNRPLELIWPGEDHSRSIRAKLEHVLERSLDGREGASVIKLDSLR